MTENVIAQTLETGERGSGGRALVSIVIVNYNGARWLLGCLKSLATLSYSPYEIIIVDNASTDESLEILRGFPGVKVVRSERNLGFAGGNNLGLRHCAGEYVLLLNNDTVAPADFLAPLCAYLDAHPEVGVVQGKMILARLGGVLDVCGSFLTRLGVPYHYGYYKPDGPNYRQNYPVFSGKGACLLFRRELVSRAGGFLFDEDFFCYYEESDFCHRAWLAGDEVHFVSSPAVEHFMGATAGGPHAIFVLRHYLRNMAFSLMANLSWTSRLQILPLFFTVLLVGLAASLVRFKGRQAAAHGQALVYCITHYSKILARRRLVKRIRRRSDREIFRKALRTPRLEYFLKTFTGTLASYVDEPLHR